MRKLLSLLPFLFSVACACSKPADDPKALSGPKACTAPAEVLELEGHKAILAQCQYGFEGGAAVCVYAAKPKPDVLCAILFQRGSCNAEWAPARVQCSEIQAIEGEDDEVPRYEGTL